MNSKQQSRHEFRVRLFTRRGWPQDKAEQWATRLVTRDAEGDARRLCIECAHLMRTGGCTQHQLGRLSFAPGKFFEPITDMLARCERFQWMTR